MLLERLFPTTSARPQVPIFFGILLGLYRSRRSKSKDPFSQFTAMMFHGGMGVLCVEVYRSLFEAYGGVAAVLYTLGGIGFYMAACEQ